MSFKRAHENTLRFDGILVVCLCDHGVVIIFK